MRPAGQLGLGLVWFVFARYLGYVLQAYCSMLCVGEGGRGSVSWWWRRWCLVSGRCDATVVATVVLSVVLSVVLNVVLSVVLSVE